MTVQVKIPTVLRKHTNGEALVAADGGTIGTIQATETIKLVCGIGEPLVGALLLYDALETRFTRVRVGRDVSCPLCGSSPEITGLVDYEEFCSR